MQTKTKTKYFRGNKKSGESETKPDWKSEERGDDDVDEWSH